MGPPAWSYEESLAWLYGRQRLGIRLGLAKVERLLAAVGDPQRAFKAVHVAGTNGKGSVTRMLAEVLRRAGFRTGATTSPHLVAFTERIEVDGAEIARADVARLLAEVRPYVEALDTEGEAPTFFEVVTAVAFLHFRDAGAAWAVVETGMGGRLDATNVLAPALTIITNVDLDHQAHLGTTVAEIAWEKAGIMKPGVPCVTAARGDALVVLKAQSHALQVPMSIVGEDYQVVRTAGSGHLAPSGFGLLRPTGESHFEVSLAGAHQHENAALVVAAVEALRLQDVPIPAAALRDGLRSARHAGRLQSFEVPAGELAPGTGADPVTVLVDGAHNAAGAYALRNHLREIRWTGFDLVVGFCADKDWEEMLEQWAPTARHVWAVPVRNPRTLEPGHVVEAVQPLAVPAATMPDARSAIAAAVGSGARRIVVAGSLFLAGEAVAVLSGRSLEEIRGSQ
ncbi:MAG: folylpolyglutamate synthase/dihydrofolate synthase family protein [Thermoplasmatota archaeon]